MNQSEHPAWVCQAKILLDESAQQFDAATLSRLNRARQAALAQGRRRILRSWFLPVGLASACALVLAVAVWHVCAPAPVAGSAARATLAAATASATANGSGFNANDLDMVSGDDSLELYQDLEFYAWLDAQDPGSDG